MKLALPLLVASVSFSSSQTNDYQKRGLGLDGPPAQSEQLLPLDYSIRAVPADSKKFLKVLALVNASLPTHRRVANPPVKIVIVQSITGGNYLARVDFGNSESDPFYLAGAPAGSPDGAHLTGIIIDAGKPYQYTDTLGAIRTVKSRRFTAATEADTLLTPDQFLARLKSGEIFTIKKQLSEQPCKACNGFGKTAVTTGVRSRDGKVTCPQCRGSGKINPVQIINVKW